MNSKKSYFLIRCGGTRCGLLGGLLCLLFVGSAGAQSNQPPTEAAGPPLDLSAREERGFQEAARRAAACVVQIETFGGLDRVDEKRVADGPTTGTIVGAEGWIISSLFSLRQQPASILVTLPGGSRVPARIVARDFNRELALLKVETDEELPVAQPADEANAAGWVGQWVVALGKTYSAESASQSIGIVSAVGRAYDRAVQTDAKISPLNYGGPLVDLQGRTLGILAAISPGSFVEGDGSQLYDSGIGFAIPLTDILERLPRLQRGEDLLSGQLGVVAEQQNELAGPVRLAGAMPGSPAARAGVRPGDIVVEAAGRPVRLLADLRHALGPRDAGDKFEFRVLRDGQRIDMSGELIAEIPTYQRRYLGLHLGASEQAGWKILTVDADSPAQQSGLQAGQHILACNDQPLNDLQQLRRQIAVAELDIPLRLQVQSDDTSAEQIEVLAKTWPNELAGSLPPADPRVEDGQQVTIVDINVGDFSNQAYALIPPLADERELGLLLVFPEPGELARDKTQQQWSSFASKFGWIVAVINSANPRRWSAEEIELAGRVVGRMEKGYSLDPAKIVFAGLGVGGRIALVAASTRPEKIRGVATLGTDLRRFQSRRPNTPLKSVDFLLVGPEDQLREPAAQLIDQGYATIVVPDTGLQPQKWETVPQSKIEFWLEGLARF